MRRAAPSPKTDLHFMKNKKALVHRCEVNSAFYLLINNRNIIPALGILHKFRLGKVDLSRSEAFIITAVAMVYAYIFIGCRLSAQSCVTCSRYIVEPV